MTKKKWFKKLVQIPLKFHHQDLHEVLNVNQNMQSLILREIQEINLRLTKLEDKINAQSKTEN